MILFANLSNFKNETILKIQNGKRKMYALKDMKLMCRTKGAIELEMYLIYNPVNKIFHT